MKKLMVHRGLYRKTKHSESFGVQQKNDKNLVFPVASIDKNRRVFLKKAALSFAGLSAFPAIHTKVFASREKIKIACSGQFADIIPYEMAVRRGHFSTRGLDAELVYAQGGNNGIRILSGGAVDFATCSFDSALNAYKYGAKIQRVLTLARHPLYALTVSPKQTNRIQSLQDIRGMKVGISRPGNSDQLLTLFLLAKEGIDSSGIRFVNLGTNLYQGLLLNQVEVGMVQEPVLTLLEQDGGKPLVNFIEPAVSQKYFPNEYEFYGLSVLRNEADRRKSQILKISEALKEAISEIRSLPISEIVAAIPRQLIPPGKEKDFTRILDQYRKIFYVDDFKIRKSACQTVVDTQVFAGHLPKGFDFSPLLNPDFLS